MLTRIKEDWTDGDVQLINEPRFQVLPDRRHPAAEPNIPTVGGVSGPLQCRLDSLMSPSLSRFFARVFEGRRQLVVYRAFFEPGVYGWPEHACRGCSLGADQVSHLAHLHARDTTLAYASRAPQPDIQRLIARMGWTMPWYTITDSFDIDFGVDEWHGHNAFIRDGEKLYRTYFINNRGDEAMGTVWSYLDITALGRQESWEESPKGYPQTVPYKWWNWHDAYDEAPSPQWAKIVDRGLEVQGIDSKDK
jgi:predicted dithiol-disulfide oxidoreductase (DUF899 family)